MKKCCYLWLCLLCLVCTLQAQDIQPGVQAQGYLESKNVTVDHSTGIFYYKVPLFELVSGNFNLPISLNYTAKGVKYEDKPGICGYNWNLQAGGVVTRTIRGGIADEIFDSGYANIHPNNTTPLENDIKNVNMHKRDGESDLFTAIFNGQSVQFIITGKEVNEFNIEPLEKTNVKIEFIKGLRSERINGWIVTDENGIRYIYRAVEWTNNISKQETVGFNNIVNKSYISSWYISEIDIPGAAPIRFTYQQETNIVKHIERTFWTYYYGRPMIERPFDFSSYQEEFNEYIEYAKSYIEHEQLMNRMENTLYEFNTYSHQYQINEDYFDNLEVYRFNERFLGALSDLSNVSEASNALMQALDALIDIYGLYTLPGSYIGDAKECVIRCLNETREVSEGGSSTTMVWQVSSPLLSGISNGRDSVGLTYKKDWSKPLYQLDSLKFLDPAGNMTSQIILATDYSGLLKNISWYGSDRERFQQQSFSYHLENFGHYTQNKWGDYDLSSDAPPEYLWDDNYSKKFSLQKITTPNGGEIEIDYENNRYEYKIYESTFLANYAGVRVKDIVLKDLSGHTDSVRYHYPYCGASVYYSLFNYEKLQYLNFHDQAISSSVIYKGNVITNTGNKGLFYHYVEEEIVGKGYNNYLFSIPPQYYLGNTAVPFHLCGLPLAKGTYDNNGNLLRLQKNKYYTDRLSVDLMAIFGNWSFDLSGWIEEPPTGLSYSKSLKQVKANGFYSDQKTLEQYYRNKPDVYLHNYRILSPYNEIYQPNLQSRTSLELEPQEYDFFYGGKTVLKEQQEYTFTGSISTAPAVTHLTGSLPANNSLLSHIEYLYDNATVHPRPTRIISHQANGDTKITQRRTALDVSANADPIITMMREANIVAPVIKEQNQIERAGITRLTEEKINLFQNLNDSVLLPGKTFRYTPIATNHVTPFTGASDNNLFSVDLSNYRMEQQITYSPGICEYLPITLSSVTDTLQFFFDRENNHRLLQASGINRNTADVIDAYQYLRLKPVLSPEDQEIYGYFELNALFKSLLKFDALHNTIVIDKCSAEFQKYYKSEAYRDLIDFIHLISEHADYEQIFPMANTIIENSNYLSLMTYYMSVEIGYTPDELYDVFCKIYQFALIFTEYPQLYPYFPDNLNNKQSTKLMISPPATVQKFQLYFVTLGQLGESQFQPTYRIRQGDAEVLLQCSAQTIVPDRWQVFAFDIDISDRTSITSLEVNSFYDEVCVILGVIVPAGTPFEAVATRPDGLPRCKLNHTGQLERYEYDGVGRVTKVFDQDGNLLKENHYSLLK